MSGAQILVGTSISTFTENTYVQLAVLFAWIRVLQELFKSLARKFNEVGITEPSFNSHDLEE
jgi:hypothetical protein